LRRWLLLAASALLLAEPATADIVYYGRQTGSGGAVVIATAGPVTLTGVVAETNMVSLRIPGGTIGKNGLVEVRCLWAYTNSANNKTLSIRLSQTSGAVTGQPGFQTVLTTTATAQSLLAIGNSGATNAQLGFANGQLLLTPYGATTAGAVTGTVDTTADAWININGIVAAAGETLTLTHATVVVFPSP